MRNRTKTQIKLILIRHGETLWNREKRYLGRWDESLSREGIRDLMKKKEAGLYPRVDFLFTSPMKRCRKTAQLIYPGQEALPVGEWVEMDFGEFEGKTYLDLRKDERYQFWIDSGGTLPFPGGESREAFSQRCIEGFYRIWKEVKESAVREDNREIRIGGIVHGGTIMALMSYLCGGDYFSYQTGNGGGYGLTLMEEAEDLRVLGFHLLPEMAGEKKDE